MNIEANIREVKGRIARACHRSHRSPDEITLVAVTKGVDASIIRDAFDCGIRDFGENRVQEAETKIRQLSDLKPNITWHMVGHLQSNKAGTALTLFDIIHSIDSVKLAQILNQRAPKNPSVLLQVNVSGEIPKSGFAVNEVINASSEIKQLQNLQVMGLMTIAPLTDDAEDVRPVFSNLRSWD